MIDNLFYYNHGREVPETAKKPIQGGRMNGKTDINPMWRIKKLTEMFGPCGIGWYYKSVNEWIETYEKEAAAFVKIELYVKINGEWSMPIQGTGGSMFVEIQRNGAYVSDECYKMATTDAISVACKQLGIGADVYWDKDNTKYSTNSTNQNQQEQPQKQGSRGTEHKTDNERNELMEKIYQELVRTGYNWGSVVKTYKAENIDGVSKLQLKDFLKKIKEYPDKAAS